MTPPLFAAQKPGVRVLQVLPALSTGGVERGTLEIAHALIDAGHHSIVVSSGGPLVSQLEAFGAQHIILPVHSKNPWLIWSNAQALRQIIRQQKIDVVHARSRAPAWSCYWACKATARPFITTFHGKYGHQNAFKREYNSVMLKGKVTIAVSHYIADHIAQTYPSHSAEVEIIQRGIDTRYFDPEQISQERIQSLIAKWGVSIEGRQTLLIPGRLTRIKGLDAFINAFAQLKDPNCLALIIGETKGREAFADELQAHIKQLNMAEQIKLVGRCDDMPAAYALSDIVVAVSSKPESFGRVTCEAQAMKKLIVATRHGGTLETIHSEQTEGLCEPGNAGSIAEAIRRVLAIDTQRKEDIGTLSREHIQQHFSLTKMTTNTLRLYERLIDPT